MAFKCAKAGPVDAPLLDLFGRPNDLWPHNQFSWGHLLWRDLPVDYVGAASTLRRCNQSFFVFFFPVLADHANLQQSGMGIDGRWNRAKTPFRTGQFGSGMSRFDSLSSGHLISAPAAIP